MKGREIEKQEELKKALREEGDYELRFKLSFLNLVLELEDVEKVAKLMGVSISTGYRWIRRWNEEGREGLKDERGKGGGKPAKLSKEEIEELKQILEEKEYWTTKEIRVLLKEKFGVEYSEDQTVRILKKLGMRHSKPFPFDYRRPKDAEKILENELSSIFKLLEEKKIPKEKVGIGFLDESSPQTTANTVRVWSFGKPVIKKNTGKVRANTIAYYALIGNSLKETLKDSTAESMKGFLEKVREANSEYLAVVVILDNFKSHRKVKGEVEESGIYLAFLPPYSPDLNPIEFIWKSIKRVLSLTLVKTKEELEEIISRSFEAFSKTLSYAEGWIKRFLKETPYYQMLCGRL